MVGERVCSKQWSPMNCTSTTRQVSSTRLIMQGMLGIYRGGQSEIDGEGRGCLLPPAVPPSSPVLRSSQTSRVEQQIRSPEGQSRSVAGLHTQFSSFPPQPAVAREQERREGRSHASRGGEVPAAWITTEEGVVSSTRQPTGFAITAMLEEPAGGHTGGSYIPYCIFFLRLCPCNACSQRYTRDGFRGFFPRLVVLTRDMALSTHKLENCALWRCSNSQNAERASEGFEDSSQRRSPP